MKDFKGKVAFITGGASGVGLGMATAFLKAGIKVMTGDINGDRATKAESILKEISSDVRAIQVDTTSMESLESAADAVEATGDWGACLPQSRQKRRTALWQIRHR
jgi:NAD(P)-dependent dehydrogenase (short-subunit alcohol dehydrogenase family)